MTKQIIVEPEEVNQRMDKLLVMKTDYSRQQIQTYIKNGSILVNGQVAKPNYKCKEADTITLHIQEEAVEEKPIEAENIPLDIVYEDNALLVVNKPRGMLVHPTHHVRTGTLVNAVKYHCKTLSDVGGEEREGIVHRLDQDTSGVIIIAKNNDVHAHLKEQFQARTVTRIYEAIVYGVVPHDQGVVRAPIGRNPKNRLEMAVVEGGKESETKFRVLERFQQYTHVECELITGRTHQIRVHMKYMNHPIIGDEVYTKKKSPYIKGQALFAKKVSFVHPVLKEQITVEVEQPSYFKSVIEKLQNIT
ncbi:RluA family pseudouridine synthase [Pseudogracilibacillus sp. SO10305]|uniref:RluA family pseudouridine synthase n=1 Tax=Pseudogracilibacillus sp. SO10305 TaxID=3098292 RepID=UPI00300E2CD8